MANIFVYDPDDSLVPGRSSGYFLSVNTPDYANVTDKHVNPDVSSLGGVSHIYWKDSSGSVVEMLQAEKDLIDSIEYFPSKRYLVEDFTPGNRLLSETWFFTDNGDESYSDKIEEHLYTYQGNVLLSSVESSYNSDGTAISVKEWDYVTSGSKRIKKKKGG